ncbi:MAG: anti-sigma factor [Acidimicrobiales bacterium]
MTDDLHDLAAAYALDALDGEERARFESHLATCEHCAADVAEMRDTARLLAEGDQLPPPPEVRTRVMDAIAAEPRAGAGALPIGLADTRRRRAVPLAAAAVLILVVVAGGMTALLRSVVEDRDAAEELVTILASPDARTAVLEGADGRTDVRVVWSPESAGAVVIGDDLPAPPEDQVYELWVLADDGPRSAGQFVPSSAGSVRSRLALPGEPADGWGITLEPTGGSPQPTGDILYLGA